MKNPSGKNHYFGILADWYDRLLVDEKNDIEYYTDLVGERGGKALELACGTGRILIPLKQRGLDIDGVDISPQMLAKCRSKLNELDSKTHLYEQDLTEFNTKTKYDTIFISGGSFCMVDEYKDAESSLTNVYNHLNDDGLFILDIFNPTANLKNDLPGVHRMIRMAEEGNESLYCYANTRYDIEEQLIIGQYKYELFREGNLQETIEDNFRMRWYGKHEFTMMLENAGFKQISVDPFSMMSSHKGTLIYKAYK